MAAVPDTSASAGAWYSDPGIDSDVVLSTRIRLARNLANFPFPENFKGDDCDRVQILVFDAFSHFTDPDSFQAVEVHNLDENGLKILTERGVVGMPTGTGIIMRSDGRAACNVNCIDHVRIASFVTGLDCDSAYTVCRSIDDEMQQHVQFAASYEFGFLTAGIADAGSGMKISLRVHLPSASYTGRIEELSRFLLSKGLSMTTCFGSGGLFGLSLGAYYQISTVSSFTGSEMDQLAAVTAAGKYIIETERKIRGECAENKPTALHDIVYRAFALAKYSRLITFREAVETLSAVKWGCDLKYITGIDDSSLCALLYRVQDGHLNFLLRNGTFTFEKDIEADPGQRTNRLRALILQEAFEKGDL